MKKSFALIAALLGAAPAHAYYAEWRDVPDFDQKRNGLCGDGKNYCGPTAASNWLAFINNHGFFILADEKVNWEASNYTKTTELIDHEAWHMAVFPTTLCDAGTSFGHYDDGLRDHLNEFEETKDAFFTMQADCEGSSYIGPGDLFLWMFMGGMVTAEVGWYEYEGGKWTMASSHFIDVVAVSDEGADKPWVCVHNPKANDSPGSLNTQSPFAADCYFLEKQYVKIRHKFQVGYDSRYQYKVVGLKSGTGKQAFLNSYTALMSPWLVGFPANSAGWEITTESIDTLDDSPHADPDTGGSGTPGSGTKSFDAPFPPGAVVDLELHTLLPGSYVRTTDGTLYYFDPARGFHELATNAGVGPIAVGRRGEIYAVTGNDITTWNVDTEELRAQPGASAHLEAPLDAVAWDEGRLRLTALSAERRMLLDLDGELREAPRAYTLETRIAVSQAPVLVYDPATSSLWLAGANALTMTRLQLDARSGLARAAETVLLPAPIAPSSINFSDGGRIIAWSGGDVIELCRDRRGFYRPNASKLAGHGMGPFMRTGRTHATRNPAVADLPVEGEESSPEGATHPLCPADINGAAAGLPDGAVDERDLEAFMRIWSSGGARADLDNGRGRGVHDGLVDYADYEYFMGFYATGCAGE